MDPTFDIMPSPFRALIGAGKRRELGQDPVSDCTRHISNSKKQQAALRILGLSDKFDFVVDNSGFSHPKPNPEVFEKAVHGLEAHPSDCLVIEDSLNGVIAGKAARCHVIGITTSFTETLLLSNGADFVIHSFSQLRPLLGKLSHS